MCICLCTSLFLSFLLKSCVHPHPKPFTSLPKAAADGHHLCQEEPKVLSTSFGHSSWSSLYWPIPDSLMTQQNTSCGCHSSRRRSNISAGLDTDSCPPVSWSLMSKDSSFWSLVCFAFVATTPIAALVWCILCQFYFFLLANERNSNTWIHEKSRADSSHTFQMLSSLFPKLRAECCLHTLPQTAVWYKDRNGTASQDSRDLLLPASSITSSHCPGLQNVKTGSFPWGRWSNIDQNSPMTSSIFPYLQTTAPL